MSEWLEPDSTSTLNREPGVATPGVNVARPTRVQTPRCYAGLPVGFHNPSPVRGAL